MRRIASSLGMRRSNSFFWTPAAHHDFERAIAYLSNHGVEPSTDRVHSLMRQHYPSLNSDDVEKHLRKRLLVRRRVQLSLGAPPPPIVPPPNIGQSANEVPFTATDLFPPTPPELAIPTLASLMARIPGGGRMPGLMEEAPAECRLSEQFSQQQQAHRQLAEMREQMRAGL